MADLWPTTLPQEPLVEGFSGTPQNTLIRTSMDAGPEKTRRRFTAASEYYTVSWVMTGAQFTTFRDFFTDTIAGGSEEFEMNHPITGETALVRFRGPYQFVSTGAHWKISAEIEVLP